MFKRFWYKLNNMAKPETKFWKQIKTNLTSFRWVRLESWASQGVPDLLGATPDGVFFTVELKATKSNRINISPHQISFHEEHKNCPSFFLVKTLTDSDPKKFSILLFGGGQSSLFLEHSIKDLEPLATFQSPIDWIELASVLSKHIHTHCAKPAGK